MMHRFQILFVALISTSAIAGNSLENEESVDRRYSNKMENMVQCTAVEKDNKTEIKKSEVSSLCEYKSISYNTPFIIPDNLDDNFLKNHHNYIFGIDISHHLNVEIDYENIYKQNIAFIYLKSTEGETIQDNIYETAFNKLSKIRKDIRPLLGSYHFLSALSDPNNQADNFLNQIKKVGGWSRQDLTPVVDLEWHPSEKLGIRDRWASHDNDDIIGRLSAFSNKVKKSSGKSPILYTSVQWINERHFTKKQMEYILSYKIWMVDSKKDIRDMTFPSFFGKKPAIWQYSEATFVRDVANSNLDGSAFNGTNRNLIESLGLHSK